MALSGLGLGLLTVPAALWAQEVVQQLPNPASATLNDAMRRLSRNPGSLPALIDAGRASLELNDVEAAEGFFQRARSIAPGDGAVLAGQALVAVRRLDPLTALTLFDQARAAGENLDRYAADHGLALDLTGQNAAAQERYGVALAGGSNAEVERRLALSYAIAGDQAASEATLRPLLDRRDVAAYRARAFALAILGREEEAVSIAEVMLPPRVATRMDPYLRHMRALTPSQQAAAANLGVFPASTDIGRDSEQLARRIDRSAVPAPSGTSDARLIPGGAPLGPSADDEAAMDGLTAEDEAALARAYAAAEADAAAARVVAPPVVVAVLEPALPAQVAPPPPPPPVVVTRLELPVPSFSIAELEPAPTPPPPPPPNPAAEAEVSLAEAFAAFTLPAATPRVRAAAGAVDITAIDPVREVRRPPPPPPPPPSPPPPPPHPSRHWVQVATGQDVAAFRFDWRRLVREADGVLAGREAYRARWGQTNRLVTGPFASAREAQAFIARLEEKGIDSFRFTSSAGEEVVALN